MIVAVVVYHASIVATGQVQEQVVVEIWTYGMRLRSTHWRYFLNFICRPTYFFELLKTYSFFNRRIGDVRLPCWRNKSIKKEKRNQRKSQPRKDTNIFNKKQKQKINPLRTRDLCYTIRTGERGGGWFLQTISLYK